LKTTKEGSGLVQTYGSSLKQLASGPVAFFASVAEERTEADARVFARANGLLLAALFFAIEVVTGGRVNWALVLAALLALVFLPFLMEGAAALGAWFMVLTSRVLGENVDLKVARKVLGFSTAGLLPLAFGGGWLSLLALWTVGLQTVGLEKALPCSRFKAAVLVGFPFLLFLTLAFMAAIIFKTRVF
jgi:hypothetical protein